MSCCCYAMLTCTYIHTINYIHHQLIGNKKSILIGVAVIAHCPFKAETRVQLPDEETFIFYKLYFFLNRIIFTITVVIIVLFFFIFFFIIIFFFLVRERVEIKFAHTFGNKGFGGSGENKPYSVHFFFTG